VTLAVTGWGAVSALGGDVPAALAALRAGRRGLARATRSGHLVPVDGQMPVVGEVPLDLPLEVRARRIVEIAVDEAIAMAGPSDARTGVFVGTTGGFFVEADIHLLERRKTDPNAPPWFGRRGLGEVAEEVARRIGATGPILTYSMACTSSSAAVVQAAAHLRAGTCGRAVIVGFDLLASMMVYGFRSLLLCDPNPCRPFDRTRAGLQLGEGCGVVVVDAGADGAFHLLDGDNRVDLSSMTASSTDGSTVEAVIRGALARSGARPDEVVTIKAHGTGTVDNDLSEGRGIARVWGDDAPAFASLKGALGHTLGASGALELAYWLAALRAGFVPGSIGFGEPDPDIGVAPLRGEIAAPRGVHLFHAFGFGGSCVAFAVRDA
jgi:3-oxoacyl-(acyl-carrier-protein) synthase